MNFLRSKNLYGGKLVHVLGGGENQLALLRKAKSLGCSVLVSDMYPDPPCKAEADFFEQVNTRDLEGSLRIAKEYKVDAVVTDQTDVAVPTVAYIAENLNLAGIGSDIARFFTDKYIMKDFLFRSRDDILAQAIPKYRLCHSLKEVVEALGDFLGNQLIIKPTNSQGSKGVFKFRKDSINDVEIKKLVERVFEESRGEPILVEEFIEGHEVAVEAFVENYEVNNLVISRKEHFKNNDCLDFRVSFLNNLENSVRQKLFNINELIIKKLNLPFGLTHAEYKIDNKGKIFLIEIAARGAGCGVSGKIVPYLTLFDTNEAILNQALGGTSNVNKIQIQDNRSAILEFFDYKPGVVKEILNSGIEKYAEDFVINIQVGDTISEVKNSRDRIGYFVVFAESNKEDIWLKLKKARESIKIIYE